MDQAYKVERPVLAMQVVCLAVIGQIFLATEQRARKGFCPEIYPTQ